MYTFTCDTCGGTFYSKADPSNWRTKRCNKCSGKPYKDLPVPGAAPVQAVPVQPVPQQNFSQPVAAPVQVQKPEFDLEAYISDVLVTYNTIKLMADEARLTIPEQSICQWVTSIMIQKEKYDKR